MHFNRRNFLKKTGMAAAATLVLPAPDNLKATSHTAAPLKKFGIQLWTVRQDMTKDAKGTLKALAGYGYTQIESFGDGDPENMFWGMKAKGFKTYIDSIGLDLVSAHCDADYTLNPARRDEFKKLADDAAGIGMKYLINPFMVQLKTIDAFKKAAEEFNKQGEICKASGLRFGYHNHNYSFRKIDGLVPQDIMMQHTDAALVDFEMDIYWVVDAGEDPESWLKKYPGRFRLCHIKDHYEDKITAQLQKVEAPEEPELGLNVSCDLGTGKIDFRKILRTAAATGVNYYLVEQERFDNSTPLRSSAVDAGYMKKLVG